MNLEKTSKRKRGVVLTAKGWHKLQQGNILESNWGDRYSFGELSDRANIDRRTVAKILSRKQGVDRRTLQMFFEAFSLELEEQDYIVPNQNYTSSEASLSRNERVPDRFPCGPVPLNSNLYIERPPVENLAYEEIRHPGSLVRIKAPRHMGKSSLMLRTIDVAASMDYRTVQVDFQLADEAVFANSNKFLRWFCYNIVRQLGIEPNLDNYWDEEIGSKVSCTVYFQEYLLEQIDSPLLLALNEVNIIFEHEEISRDFLPLLRFWYEQAKLDETFQKLRVVVAHSTEVYVSLNINQSPFNVGLALDLPEFNLEQVIELALRHGLNWVEDASEAKQLMAMVGGHPYLIRLALYYLSKQETLLESLLQEAPTQSGIYIQHLRSQSAALQKQTELAEAFQQVIKAKEPIRIAPMLTYKLDSMGLVKIVGDTVVPSCRLYQLYFD
ncbi:MAG: AAA-like domain-containing protein [Prochloraceae cyanobacterium]|nr:AAA-like domain-containing protein [Prochloraceae cyanobacterium]